MTTLPVKVAHEIEHEQYDEYKAKPATAPCVASVGITATAEEKNKDNNNKD